MHQGSLVEKQLFRRQPHVPKDRMSVRDNPHVLCARETMFLTTSRVQQKLGIDGQGSSRYLNVLTTGPVEPNKQCHTSVFATCLNGGTTWGLCILLRSLLY